MNVSNPDRAQGLRSSGGGGDEQAMMERTQITSRQAHLVSLADVHY